MNYSGLAMLARILSRADWCEYILTFLPTNRVERRYYQRWLDMESTVEFYVFNHAKGGKAW